MWKAGIGGGYSDVRKIPGGELHRCYEGPCRTGKSRKQEKSRRYGKAESRKYRSAKRTESAGSAKDSAKDSVKGRVKGSAGNA